MLDLETFSTKHNAAIVSIGAAAFDDESIVDSFYRSVSLESSINEGLSVDGDTVSWWFNQEDAAQAVLHDEEKLSLFDAMQDFYTWLCSFSEDLVLWGNGASFDNVVIKEAFYALEFAKEALPWSHHGDRCYRTLKNLRPEILIERIGTHHNAMDDAMSQANHAIKILKEIKNGS